MPDLARAARVGLDQPGAAGETVVRVLLLLAIAGGVIGTIVQIVALCRAAPGRPAGG